jgi:hypothetical protein
MNYSKTVELLTTTSAGEVNLFQWDIVNATTFKGVNRSVAIQDKTPKTFDNKSPVPPAGVATVDGAWDTWQLTTGGMGNEVMMELPVKSGSTTYTMFSPSYAKLSPPKTNATTQGNVSLGADQLTLEAQDLKNLNAHAFSEQTVKAGKIYFEVTLETNGFGALIGLARLDAPDSNFWTDAHSISYRSNGAIFYGGQPKGVVDAQGNTENGARWTIPNSTVGMAVDFDNGQVWLRAPDGTWQGANADPENNTGALTSFDVSQDLYPLVGVYSQAKAKINLGQEPFVHPLPTGFEKGIKISDTVDRTQDLAGVKITARVTLQKKDNGTKTKALMVNDQPGATTEAVTITSITRNGLAVVPPIRSAFDAWLNEPANLSKFDNIFHAIDYAKLASQNGDIKDTMKWIAPVYSDYAVADIPTASPGGADAIFAVLNQTAKSTVDKSTLAAEVSPDLMANLQPTENAVVAISAERLTEEILLAGAYGAAADGERPDFQIDGAKRVVTNGAEFKLRPTKLAQAGDLVQPIVPAGGFTMRIVGRQIAIEYTGLHFDFANQVLKQNEKVTFGYQQTMFLTLEERADGSHILVPTFNDPLGKQPKSKGEIVDWTNVIDKWTVSMKLDPPTQDKTMLWIGLACGVVGLVLGGLTIYGVTRCVAAAGSDAEAAGDVALQDMQNNNGEADFGMPAVQEASQYDRFPPPQNIYDNVQADVANNIYDDVNAPLSLFALGDADADVKAELAAKPAKALASGSLLYTVHWGVALHGLRAMAGLDHVKQLNLSAEDIKKFAGGDVDVLGLEATVQNFLKTALSPFDWPETTGFDLKTANLQGALLLQGELKSSTVKSSSKGNL